MSEKGHWSAGAQGVAALVTALVAIGAFFGLQRSGDKPPEPAATQAAPAASPSATPLGPPGAGTGPIMVEGARVALGPAGAASPEGVQKLTAVVTMRIRNAGDLPVSIAWLDAAHGAALDLDDGTRLAGGEDSVFTGFPDCERDRASKCSARNATRLIPGETQLATVTLSALLGSDERVRVKRAGKGNFSGRLAILPGSDDDAYAKSVSLAEMAVTNAAR